MAENMTKDTVTKAEIAALLPGFHCGGCGEKRCDAFAGKLLDGERSLDGCVNLRREQFSENRASLLKLLAGAQKARSCAGTCPDGDGAEICGLIDGYEADLLLHPLPGEPSCREVLFPFARTELKAGEIVKYRPLGCPIFHFAKILEASNGLITVHMVGPGNRLEGAGFQFKEIGLCMVGGFEGTFTGPAPFVGQSVRFVPHHCMMGKVHTGVVVQVIGDRIIIEGIDLKVWAPPIMKREKEHAE